MGSCPDTDIDPPHLYGMSLPLQLLSVISQNAVASTVRKMQK